MLTRKPTGLAHNFANFKAQQRDELATEGLEDLLNILGLETWDWYKLGKNSLWAYGSSLSSWTNIKGKCETTRKSAACTIDASSPKQPILLSNERRSATEFFNNLKSYTPIEETTEASEPWPRTPKFLGEYIAKGSPSQTQEFITGEGKTSRNRS